MTILINDVEIQEKNIIIAKNFAILNSRLKFVYDNVCPAMIFAIFMPFKILYYREKKMCPCMLWVYHHRRRAVDILVFLCNSFCSN